MMFPVQILFRKSIDTEEEFVICSKYFDTKEIRSECWFNAHIIGRYSVLPHYRELEKDLANMGSVLVNCYSSHKYIANFDYYFDLEQYTPKTWFNLQDIPEEEAPFVVKGKTNSKKYKWNKLMYAPDRKTAIAIAAELMDDPLISEQGVIVRKYIPLELLEEGIYGQPFVNEHRLFFYKTNMLCPGFYWVQSEKTAKIDANGLSFAQNIAKIVAKRVNFFVLDIAKTITGDWILVEVNDAQMSGLSMCDPDLLYSNLKNVIENEQKQTGKGNFP